MQEPRPVLDYRSEAEVIRPREDGVELQPPDPLWELMVVAAGMAACGLAAVFFIFMFVVKAMDEEPQMAMTSAVCAALLLGFFAFFLHRFCRLVRHGHERIVVRWDDGMLTLLDPPHWGARSRSWKRENVRELRLRRVGWSITLSSLYELVVVTTRRRAPVRVWFTCADRFLLLDLKRQLERLPPDQSTANLPR